MVSGKKVSIGVPKETKNGEYRVGLTPAAVKELTSTGVLVYVEATAGEGAGFGDAAYREAGAAILPSAEDLFQEVECVVKVKEPQLPEIARLRPEQILFTFLHLAAEPDKTKELLASGATAIAYETIYDTNGQGDRRTLPILAPMSQIAGRLAVQQACLCLEKIRGGNGILLGGIAGVKAAKVVIIGGGQVGTQAALMATGMQGRVTVLDTSLGRLQELAIDFQGKITTQYATQDALEVSMAEADVVIGGVLIPGATAPKVIKRSYLAAMRSGSVFVDVAIDQGGCSETSRPTTLDAPTYVESGVIHYSVTNLPSLVARTASEALSHATLPYVKALAHHGMAAVAKDPGFLAGLTLWRGRITCRPVMEALFGETAADAPYLDPELIDLS